MMHPFFFFIFFVLYCLVKCNNKRSRAKHESAEKCVTATAAAAWLLSYIDYLNNQLAACPLARPIENLYSSISFSF
jgi:hypothetical protein